MVFQRQQPLLRRDLDKERQYPAEDLAYGDGVRSYVIVPLIARGTSIGTLAVASTTASQYDEADAAFLQEAANQIALVGENIHDGNHHGTTALSDQPSPGLGTLEEMERAHILATLEKTGWLIEGAKGAAKDARDPSQHPPQSDGEARHQAPAPRHVVVPDPPLLLHHDQSWADLGPVRA
jgi:hypothetical protein